MNRAVLALVLLALPAAALAHELDYPCQPSSAPALAGGPLLVGFSAADVGTGRRACPRTELAFGGQGGAIIDLPDFYGAITGAGVLAGSYALRPDLELFATLEAARFQYVQNAALTATTLSLGQLTAGATWVAWSEGHWVVAPSARLQLPTSFASPRTRTVGAEVGAAFLYRPSVRFEVHGFAGAGVSAAVSGAAPLPRAGVLLNLGAQYAFAPWFALTLDGNLRMGERDTLDYLAPALGLRFALGNNLGAELSAALPVAGAERALAAGALRVSWRL
jgi:hypothetical protein